MIPVNIIQHEEDPTLTWMGKYWTSRIGADGLLDATVRRNSHELQTALRAIGFWRPPGKSKWTFGEAPKRCNG
jgi:hypothetical protein